MLSGLIICLLLMQGCTAKKQKTEALPAFKKPVIVYSFRAGKNKPKAYSFQHIGILSLEFHVDKLSRPLL